MKVSLNWLREFVDCQLSADKLEALFTRTRSIRREVIDAGQESAAPNFGRDKREG